MNWGPSRQRDTVILVVLMLTIAMYCFLLGYRVGTIVQALKESRSADITTP
jgi:hypothetical protein